jgi:hypothetical protein
MHAWREENAMRAQGFCGAAWHSGTHSELPGLVAGSAHDSAAIRGGTYDDRLPFQLWSITLLDRCEKGIHIDVHNDSLACGQAARMSPFSHGCIIDAE